MERLFQALDEIDDLVTIVRHLLLRHGMRVERRKPRRAPAAAADPRAPSIAVRRAV